MESEYSLLADKDLYDLLQKATLADRLTMSSEWKLLKEASERIVERAIYKLVFKIDTSNIKEVENIRATIEKYKYGLFAEIETLKDEAEVSYHEASARGLIESHKIRTP